MTSVNAREEQTKSLWMNVDVAPDAPVLTKNETADVVVVGSGIAGLSTAYELQLRGLKVAVVDRGAIAGGMTARTSAHLTSMSDDGFDTLSKLRGEQASKTFYASHAAAIDRIERNQAEEKIECNFRRVNGYLFPAPNMAPKDLVPEFDATRRAGMPVDRHNGVPFHGLSDIGCLRYPQQATFHPLRYLRGIADTLTDRGAKLYAHTAVTKVEERDKRVRIETENGQSISADFAVVATNSPINDRTELHSKQAPYRTYVIVLTIEKDRIEDALYWDTLDAYHYVRLQPGPGRIDYLIVGGADHKTGEADDADVRFEGLEAWIPRLIARPRQGHSPLVRPDS